MVIPTLFSMVCLRSAKTFTYYKTHTDIFQLYRVKDFPHLLERTTSGNNKFARVWMLFLSSDQQCQSNTIQYSFINDN